MPLLFLIVFIPFAIVFKASISVPESLSGEFSVGCYLDGTYELTDLATNLNPYPGIAVLKKDFTISGFDEDDDDDDNNGGDDGRRDRRTERGVINLNIDDEIERLLQEPATRFIYLEAEEDDSAKTTIPLQAQKQAFNLSWIILIIEIVLIIILILVIISLS